MNDPMIEKYMEMFRQNWQPIAILYRLPETSDAGWKFRQILQRSGIAVKEAEEDDLQQTVGYLAGIDGYEKTGATDGDRAASVLAEKISDQPFLLMCRFTPEMLDGLLADMKAAGIYIPHKAMMTGTNRDYTMGYLIQCVEEEHAAMAAQMKRAGGDRKENQ